MSMCVFLINLKATLRGSQSTMASIIEIKAHTASAVAIREQVAVAGGLARMPSAACGCGQSALSGLNFL